MLKNSLGGLMGKAGSIAVILSVLFLLQGCASMTGKKVRYMEISTKECYICQRMDPIINEIESEYGNEVDISTYSGKSDGGEDLIKKYNIKKFPANIFLDDKDAVFFRYEGLLDVRSIKDVLKMKGIGVPASLTQPAASDVTVPAAAK